MMRTLLICHEEDELEREGMARWLASFSTLAGVVVIRETGGRLKQRVKREVKRVGWLRFADVVAFRFYYKFFIAPQDAVWRTQTLEIFRKRFADLRDVPHIIVSSPNSPEAEAFIKTCAPDIALARCKTLLKESIFTIPRTGTFVMHPGVCPEYRNSHGCFWALANDDLTRVGMTLLKIDKGVDTGGVFGFYSYPFDEVAESHVMIQGRAVYENLDVLAEKLSEIYQGEAQTIDTSGRKSAVWGQVWLSKYLRWKDKAHARRKHGRAFSQQRGEMTLLRESR